MHITLVVAYFVLALFGACSQTSEPTWMDPEFVSSQNRDGQLVEAYIHKLVNPKFENLQQNIEQLKLHTTQSCSQRTALPLEQLQALWAESVQDFHYLATLVKGPLTLYQDSSPLRFIYSRPLQRTPLFIEREITKANRDKENYSQQRPLAHSLGFQALEYVLFEHLSENSNAQDDGTCFYLGYVLSDLDSRIDEYQNLWLEEEVAQIESPQGQTQLADTIAELALHLQSHSREILLNQSTLEPLGLHQEIANCGSLQECISSYSDHPYYGQRKTKLSSSLQALNDIFNGKVEGDSRSFSFRDFFVHLKDHAPHPLDQVQSLLTNWQSLPAFELQGLSSESMTLPQNTRQFVYSFETFVLWMTTDMLVDLNAEMPRPVQGDGD